jgi:hypothetical protein
MGGPFEDPNLAAGWMDQPERRPHRRRLARTVWAQQTKRLALPDIKIDAIEY